MTPPDFPIPPAAMLLVVFLLIIAVQFAALARFYRRVGQGQALVRNGVGGTRVSFTGMFCLPLLHRTEFIDITIQRINASFRDEQSLTTRDGVQVEAVAAFFIRIAQSPEDVLRVASTIGAAKAGDQEDLERLFQSRFAESLAGAVRESTFEDIDQRREAFRADVIQRIGSDLSGYTLENVALDHFGKRDWTAG
jgi:flotillin